MTDIRNHLDRLKHTRPYSNLSEREFRDSRSDKAMTGFNIYLEKICELVSPESLQEKVFGK